MKKILILILYLLFTSVFLHAEALLNIAIEGSDNIKAYIAKASPADKKQITKLIQAGNKFAKLDLDGDICGCEPDVECPKILNLTDYSSLNYEVENSMFNQYCNVEPTHKRADGSALSMDWYLIDKDTRLDALTIDEKGHKAILTYSSSLVGVFREGEVSKDCIGGGIVSWDTSNRGQNIKINYMFNTLTNRAISRSPTNIFITYYHDRIYAANAYMGCMGNYPKNDEDKRQKKLANEITADLLNYQKTHQRKNFNK